MKARKCGQSWFKDWDRGVGGGVAKRPLLLCPGPNELPRRGSWLAEALEFRFTGVGLLYGLEFLRAQGGRLVEGQCPGADEGGVAGGCAKRRAASRPHRAPMRGRAWARTAAQKYWGVVGGVERGVGKRGCGRGLVGGQSEGGGVCAARMLRKLGTLKERSQKVARLQASLWPVLFTVVGWGACTYL